MLANHRSGLSAPRLAILLILLVVQLASWTSTPASAEGLSEFLFGNVHRPPIPSPQAPSHAQDNHRSFRRLASQYAK